MRCARKLLAIALSGAAIGILAGKPADAEPAGATRAGAAVRVSRSGGDARADLAAALPGAGGRLLIISPKGHFRDLLIPLARAGLLKELVSVLPHEEALLPGDLGAILSILEREGVSPADRGTFTMDNGSIRGRVEGVPVVLCTLPRIPKQQGAVLPAVDTAFLPAIYRNEVKTPMMELAWKVVLTLRSRGAIGGRAVLFDAVGDPDFPLEFGYLTTLLAEMLSVPGDFENDLPEKWRMLEAAGRASFFGQSAEATTLLKEYLAKAPGDASACYRIARIAIFDLDVDLALHWLGKAGVADARFARAFVEAAEYLARKNLAEPAERVLRAGGAAFPDDPRVGTPLAAFLVERGEGLRDSGDAEGAARYFAAAAGVPAADPAIREKARGLMPGNGRGGAPAPR